MALHTTTRLGLRYPDLTQAADLAFLLQTLAQDIDGITAGYGEGVHASRPAAGVAGRFYWETDSVQLFYDDGAVWRGLLPGTGSITSGMILDGTIVDADVAADTLTARVIAANAIGASELADNSVDTAAIVDGSVGQSKAAVGAFAGQSYGTTLPTTSLYNGYRYTLFLTNPFSGSVACDVIYRADLDGTYPWHVCSSGDIANSSSGNTAGTSTPYNDVATLFTIPRSGVWSLSYTHANVGTAPGSVFAGLKIAGTQQRSRANGDINDIRDWTLSSGNTVVVQSGNDSGGTGGWYVTGILRPVKII